MSGIRCGAGPEVLRIKKEIGPDKWAIVFGHWQKEGHAGIPSKDFVQFHLDRLDSYYKNPSSEQMDMPTETEQNIRDVEQGKATIPTNATAQTSNIKLVQVKSTAFAEILPKLQYDENKEGVPITRPLYPDFSAEVTPQMKAGTYVHGIIEAGFKAIQEGKVPRGAMISAIDQLSKSDLGTSLGNAEDTLDTLANYLTQISEKYHVLGTEIPVSIPMDEKSEWRGRIDLVLQDKDTGEILVGDYKTSYDKQDLQTAKVGATIRKQSGWSEGKWNKTYLQLSMYEHMLNTKSEGLIDGKFSIPLAVSLDENNQITDIGLQNINGTNRSNVYFDGMHKMQDTAMLKNTLADTYGLQEYYPQTIEQKVNNFTEGILEYAKHYNQDPNIKQLLKGVFAKHNMPDAFFEAARVIKNIITVIKEHPNDERILLDSSETIQNSIDFVEELQSSASGDSVLDYATNIIKHDNPKQYVNQYHDALATLKKSLDVTNDYIIEQKTNFLKQYWSPVKTAMWEHAEKPAYAEKAWEILQDQHPQWKNRHSHTKEVDAKAEQLMEKDRASIENRIDNWFTGITSESTTSSFRFIGGTDLFRWFNNLSVIRKVSPMSAGTNEFAQVVVNDLYSSNFTYKDSVKKHNDELISIVKELPQEEPPFYFLTTQNTKGQNCIIEEFKNSEAFADKRAYVDKSVEGLVEGTSAYEVAANKATNEWIKENTKKRDIPIEESKEKLVSIIQDAVNSKTIVSDRFNELKSKIDECSSFEDIKDLNFNPDNLTEAKLLAEISDQAKSSIVLNEKWRDEKYIDLMRLPENSPERRLYNKINEFYEECKIFLPEYAQLEHEEDGKRIPAVYANEKDKLGATVADKTSAKYWLGNSFDKDQDAISNVSLSLFKTNIHPDEQTKDVATAFSFGFNQLEKYKHLSPALARIQMALGNMEELGRTHPLLAKEVEILKQLTNSVTSSGKGQQGVAQKILRIAFSAIAYKYLGNKLVSPYLSYISSVTSMNLLAYGERQLNNREHLRTLAANLLNVPTYIKHMKEGWDEIAHTKSHAVLNFFGIDNRNPFSKHAEKETLASKALSTINKIGFLSWKYSDGPIKHTAAETAARCIQLYKENEQGDKVPYKTLWDALSYKDGSASLDSDNLFMEKGEGKKLVPFDKKYVGAYLEKRISYTTTPTSMFYKSAASTSLIGRMTTMIRTIPLNLTQLFLGPAHYNQMTGGMEVGPIAGFLGSGIQPDEKFLITNRNTGEKKWTGKAYGDWAQKVILGNLSSIIPVIRPLIWAHEHIRGERHDSLWMKDLKKDRITSASNIAMKQFATGLILSVVANMLKNWVVGDKKEKPKVETIGDYKMETSPGKEATYPDLYTAADLARKEGPLGYGNPYYKDNDNLLQKRIAEARYMLNHGHWGKHMAYLTLDKVEEGALYPAMVYGMVTNTSPFNGPPKKMIDEIGKIIKDFTKKDTFKSGYRKGEDRLFPDLIKLVGMNTWSDVVHLENRVKMKREGVFGK